MAAGRMRRVGKQNPCPICEKLDWCLVAEDGSAAICARIEQGSTKRCGDAGWLHILRDDDRRPRSFSRRIRVDTNVKDFSHLAETYQQQLTAEDLRELLRSLDVSESSLKRLRVGWDGQAYTFPMSDAAGTVIGIRRRFPDGRKVSITGGRTGLFIPTDLAGEAMLLLCEGPTDTAAALDLGFDAVGRPNCNSRVEMTARAARGRREIAIVADNDEVGRAGAKRLADALVLHYPCVKIIYPPDDIKDLRKWLQAGLTHETLRQIIKDAKPVELAISFKD